MGSFHQFDLRQRPAFVEVGFRGEADAANRTGRTSIGVVTPAALNLSGSTLNLLLAGANIPELSSLSATAIAIFLTRRPFRAYVS